MNKIFSINKKFFICLLLASLGVATIISSFTLGNPVSNLTISFSNLSIYGVILLFSSLFFSVTLPGRTYLSVFIKALPFIVLGIWALSFFLPFMLEVGSACGGGGVFFMITVFLCSPYALAIVFYEAIILFIPVMFIILHTVMTYVKVKTKV